MDPVSHNNDHPQERAVDGLFMLQHNVPKKSSGWSQSLEKDVAKALHPKGFLGIGPQPSRELRELLVFYERIRC